MEQEVASFFWGLKKFACVADQQSKLFDIFVKNFLQEKRLQKLFMKWVGLLGGFASRRIFKLSLVIQAQVLWGLGSKSILLF